MYLSITDGSLYHEVPALQPVFSASFTWTMIVWSTVITVYKNISEQVIIVFQQGDYSLQAFSYTKLMFFPGDQHHKNNRDHLTIIITKNKTKIWVNLADRF